MQSFLYPGSLRYDEAQYPSVCAFEYYVGQSDEQTTYMENRKLCKHEIFMFNSVNSTPNEMDSQYRLVRHQRSVRR